MLLVKLLLFLCHIMDVEELAKEAVRLRMIMVNYARGIGISLSLDPGPLSLLSLLPSGG